MRGMRVALAPLQPFRTQVSVPGDKSISHRSLILSALSQGKSEVIGLLKAADVDSTLNCLRFLGVSIVESTGHTSLEPRRHIIQCAKGLQPTAQVLNCGNSGTTLRLLMGVLAGQPFSARLEGDTSLSRRPMRRIAEPLRQQGAQISLTHSDFPPVTISGKYPLQPLHYSLPVASAQLKSSLLLAGLFAKGETVLTGKLQSRDHTEKLLRHWGAELSESSERITLQGLQILRGTSFSIPSDPSSAAYWIALATLLPNSSVEIPNLLLNPTRIGFFKVLERMGAKIEMEITSHQPERIGTVYAKSSTLRATTLGAEEVPFLIDEIPLLSVVAAFAEGTTDIRGAKELRIKESDRIETVVSNLRAMNAKVESFPDGLSIEGQGFLDGATLDSFHDHRIAMSFTIAALLARSPSTLENAECVDISYPEFFKTLEDHFKHDPSAKQKAKANEPY